jgi:hypothetical protein
MDDVALLGERIRKAEWIIREKQFAPNPTWTLCSPKYCPFYQGCQVTGELRKTPVEILEKYNG